MRARGGPPRTGPARPHADSSSSTAVGDSAPFLQGRSRANPNSLPAQICRLGAAPRPQSWLEPRRSPAPAHARGSSRDPAQTPRNSPQPAAPWDTHSPRPRAPTQEPFWKPLISHSLTFENGGNNRSYLGLAREAQLAEHLLCAERAPVQLPLRAHAQGPGSVPVWLAGEATDPCFSFTSMILSLPLSLKNKIHFKKYIKISPG